MILAVAATEFELKALPESDETKRCIPFLSGVGPVESCIQLTRFLSENRLKIDAVINFGIAGAYIHDERRFDPEILDICLAETEVLGDLGVCFPRRIDDLSPVICSNAPLKLDELIGNRVVEIFEKRDLKLKIGNFVTVNCASGTRDRGEILRRKYNAICENMEGAAIARVCREFSLPLVEMRCVSNYVEDRDPGSWKIQEACERAGHAVSLLIQNLSEYHGTD